MAPGETDLVLNCLQWFVLNATHAPPPPPRIGMDPKFHEHNYRFVSHTLPQLGSESHVTRVRQAPSLNEQSPRTVTSVHHRRRNTHQEINLPIK